MEIPEFKMILEAIKNLEEKLNNPVEKNEIPEWLNDEQCWKLKGGCALNTFRNNRFYQPMGGIPDAYVGGRKVWNKSTVLDWLKLTDDQLPEYHLINKTGAKKK